MTKGRRILPTRISRPAQPRVRGVRIVFAGSDGVEKAPVLFLDRSFQSRRQGVRLPEIPRDARARQQPDQERVVPFAFRQLQHVRDFILANSATIIQQIPGSASPLQPEMAFFPFGRYARPDCRIPGEVTESPDAELFGGRSRSISASVIAGARMNRICCSRSTCPTTVRPVLRRPSFVRDERRRPEHHRSAKAAASAGARRAAAAKFSVVFALGKSPNTAPHQRTVWLGSIKALLAGGCRLWPKKWPTAMMAMTSASAANRSICRDRRCFDEFSSASLTSSRGTTTSNQYHRKAWFPAYSDCSESVAASGFREPLTWRQRPNRHGKYHRAPAGFVSGTLSMAEVPQG